MPLPGALTHTVQSCINVTVRCLRLRWPTGPMAHAFPGALKDFSATQMCCQMLPRWLACSWHVPIPGLPSCDARCARRSPVAMVCKVQKSLSVHEQRGSIRQKEAHSTFAYAVLMSE